MIIALFIPLILLIISLTFTGIAINEFIEEKKFKQQAVKTKGQIVGVLQGKRASQEIGGFFLGQISETFTKNILLIEYKTDNGDIYRAQTKKVYNEIKRKHLSVHYNPSEPTEIMIDSFYKTGSSKYFRLIFGFILGIISFFLLIAVIRDLSY